MGAKLVFSHRLGTISVLHGFQTVPGRGKSPSRVPPISGDAQEITQEPVPLPVNSDQTSPGLWPPREWGCPDSAWLTFSPGRLLATWGPLGMQNWTSCLAHPLCQETVCHSACSVVGLREQNRAWGLVGGSSKFLSVTNVAPQGPIVGDPGPCSTCSLGWISSVCSWTGHPHTHPPMPEPPPLWALSGGLLGPSQGIGQLS